MRCVLGYGGLSIIFENTIRRHVNNRAPADQLLTLTSSVYAAIFSKRFPLEYIPIVCSVCGIGALALFKTGHAPFGSNKPEGVEWKHCLYCGCCFPINEALIKKKLEARTKLE